KNRLRCPHRQMVKRRRRLPAPSIKTTTKNKLPPRLCAPCSFSPLLPSFIPDWHLRSRPFPPIHRLLNRKFLFAAPCRLPVPRLLQPPRRRPPRRWKPAQRSVPMIASACTCLGCLLRTLSNSNRPLPSVATVFSAFRSPAQSALPDLHKASWNVPSNESSSKPRSSASPPQRSTLKRRPGGSPLAAPSATRAVSLGRLTSPCSLH